MRSALFALLIIQCSLTGVAVVFNGVLFVIIVNSKTKMGNYKHIMKAFTIFEALFAVVCLIGMPMHSISDRTWIEFTYFGILGNTRFSKLGPILYCLMYEIWLGFIILHFLYRYFVLCKVPLSMYIRTSKKAKGTIIGIIVFYLVLCLICSLYLCPYDVASQTLDGVFSFIGLLALLIHYIAVISSTLVVVFCSYSIWRVIHNIQSVQENSNLFLERQLFLTLFFQTMVPVILCHIPSMFVLSFPLWENNMTIGPLSSFFPIFLTITKVIDPILPIICIAEYRKIFRQLICYHKKKIIISSSVAPFTDRTLEAS